MVNNLAQDGVHVFHHIPKCGGSSLLTVLEKWFVVKSDYREDWSENYPEKQDLNLLNASHCLVGHWEVDGYYLYQRYPEIIKHDNYRIFTFLREPLEVQLSLYSYEKKYAGRPSTTIIEHLSLRPNYLASVFPATEDNYKEILDRYFFIGILEQAQESLSQLAHLLSKPEITMPNINKMDSRRCLREHLCPEIVEKFRHENKLDYMIYEYAVERYCGGLK
jgi:hypothetical protein